MAKRARKDADVKKALERYIMERVQDRVRFYKTTECYVEIGKKREILVRLNGSIPKIWHENALCMASGINDIKLFVKFTACLRHLGKIQ